MTLTFRPYKLEWDSTGDGSFDSNMTPIAINSNFEYDPFNFNFNNEQFIGSDFSDNFYINRGNPQLIEVQIDMIVTRSQLDTLFSLIYNTLTHFDILDDYPQYILRLKDADNNQMSFYVAESVSDGYEEEVEFIITSLTINHRVSNRSDTYIHITINLLEIKLGDIDRVTLFT